MIKKKKYSSKKSQAVTKQDLTKLLSEQTTTILDAVDSRIGKFEAKVETKMDHLETKMDHLETRMDDLEKRMVDMEGLIKEYVDVKQAMKIVRENLPS